MSLQPEAPLRKPIKLVVNAFDEFVHSQLCSGLFLVICTIVALIWANSRYASTYFQIDHTYAGIHFAGLQLKLSLGHWINDGLMAVFFLFVGLEIKREVVAGELSAFSTALLPVLVAIGGMVFPALIYWGVNHGDVYALKGWAVPMATDIAFALGLLSLLNNRIPRNLVVFLTAVAIIDDLGAIIIIAVFYSKHIALAYLGYATICLALLCIMNIMRIRRLTPYIVVGVVMWAMVLQSGIHATIAGVLLAFTIPARSYYKPGSVTSKLTVLMGLFDGANRQGGVDTLETNKRTAILQSIENLVHDVETPLQRLEHMLQVPVSFLIVPIFVLFNAGVSFSGIHLGHTLLNPITLGIILGLVIGKCIGIFGTTAVCVKSGMGRLPEDVPLRLVFPLSLFAGIGFTMAIFITELAFGNTSNVLSVAKVGILAASLIAAILGIIMMFLFTRSSVSTSHD